MEFEDVLAQTIALLQHQSRISYGALNAGFSWTMPTSKTSRLNLLRPNTWRATRTVGSWSGRERQ